MSYFKGFKFLISVSSSLADEEINDNVESKGGEFIYFDENSNIPNDITHILMNEENPNDELVEIAQDMGIPILNELYIWDCLESDDLIDADPYYIDPEIPDNESVNSQSTTSSGSDIGDNPVEMIQEMGNNPLMQRVLAALESQLEQTSERINLELQEKLETFRGLKKEREDVGVELYAIQQQLARLQMTLENSHNEFNESYEARQEEEHILNELREVYDQQQSLLEEKKRQLVKNESELQAMNETLRQVENYNEEMRGEIAASRRAAYKAEENIQQLEKQKKGQDLYIDKLSDQLQSLEEQIAVYETQLELQNENADDSDEIIQKTTKEMEMLVFEKKQLIQQWKSSLIGLTRRDEALSAAKESLRKEEMKVRDLDTEILGLKKDLLKEQNKNETLVSVRERLNNELVIAQEHLDKIEEETESLSQRFILLQRSIKQTESEESKVELTNKQLKSQLDQIIQNIQVVIRERQKLEEGIRAYKSTQSTVSKAVHNLQKETTSVISRIHEKEMGLSQLQNEISRIQVDKLNTQAHNQQLSESLQKLLLEIREKDALIEKYELEIRQRNNEIEKKMHRVDRLNKQYEKLLESAEDEENMGPLEATIRNLGREIENINKEIEQSQKEWLNDQTLLVEATSITDNHIEKNSELNARLSILTQKRNRLTQSIKNSENEYKFIESGNKTLRSDMSKINQLISKNLDLYSELENQNYVMEMEFVEELKELENESLKLENDIVDKTNEKEKLLEDIMETEKQVLLWEKKIQLERETQAALDPEVGMSEVKGMEKEIHRMKIRLESLRRDEERMVREMERAIHKREDIALKHRNRTASHAKKQTKMEFTQQTLAKRIKSLRRKLKQTTKEAKRYDNNINSLKNSMHNLTNDLENETINYGQLEENANNLQSDINDLLYAKQRQAEALYRKQRMYKNLKNIDESQSAGESSSDQALEIERKLHQKNLQLQDTLNIVQSLKNNFPHLSEVLDRVSDLI